MKFKQRTRFGLILAVALVIIFLFATSRFDIDINVIVKHIDEPAVRHNSLHKSEVEENTDGKHIIPPGIAPPGHLDLTLPSLVKSQGSPFHQASMTPSSLQSGSSSTSVQEPACKLPQILVDDPHVQPYLKQWGPLSCSNETNWVYTANGRFYIYSDAVKRHGKIDCYYWRYDRMDDYYYFENPIGWYENDTALIGDQFYVRCKAYDNSTYDNLHAAVPRPSQLQVHRLQKLRKYHTNGLDMNVFVYLMDSVSRVNFIRKLPNLYKLFVNKMNANVMEGYNVVGDGTVWAMVPMLTGLFPTELPEARRSQHNASFLDDWPFVFKNFTSSGYVTSYAEEQALLGAFYYKLKGFKDQPVDHYLRTMLVALEQYQEMHKPYCLGDTPRSILWLKFWRELQDVYRPLKFPQFSIMFSSETSHDDYNYVQSLDEHWTKEFETLFDGGYFNDTILVVMADHGRRFGAVRQTQTGKLEEKLPFLAIIVPPAFRHRYPLGDANLQKNRQRLVTVFDLHATFLNVLNMEKDGGLGRVSNRGISLFQEMPLERTCAHAHIKAHFCGCLDWTEEKNLADRNIIAGANKVIDYFNQQIMEVGNRCANLSLGKVISARILKPNRQLMAFKESFDFDNRIPNFSSDTELDSLLYQIRFLTEPGGGDWEATVTYYKKMNTFGVSSDDISRLNMYNHQAQCVINTHQHLRTFCYCLN